MVEQHIAAPGQPVVLREIRISQGIGPWPGLMRTREFTPVPLVPPALR